MRFSYALDGHFFEIYYRPFSFARQCLRSWIPLDGKKGQFMAGDAGKRGKGRERSENMNGMVGEAVVKTNILFRPWV